ncbi:MAG TPA: GeoRSP system PqqD family peptide chaperone [Desulfuromonadaceae bacterium]|jgi:GeoRSP system PqqD family protein
MQKIQRNPEVLWREEDDSRQEALAGLDQGQDVADIGTSLLFHNGQMVSLNILGTEIWKLCDGRTASEIIATLFDSFEVEENELTADVAAFLDELAEKGFIDYGE